MADIHITRQHSMTLGEARKTAFNWAQEAKAKFDMACTYEEGDASDICSFNRSGVTGTMTVDKDTFVLTARLGFLLSAFKDRIESEIVKNLDALIAKKTPAAKKVPAKAVKKNLMPVIAKQEAFMREIPRPKQAAGRQ